MGLVTHQVQGSYTPLRYSWKRGIKSKQNLATFPTVKRTGINLCKHTSCLCLAAPLIHGSRWKSLRISSFKRSVQSDEYGERVSGSKSVKNSVKPSYASQDSEETLSGLPKLQNIHAHSTSDADETTAGSLAIQNLFKSWLTLLRMPSPNQDETAEGQSLNETIETEHKIQKDGILKTVWCNFLGLDATLKIPAMIFIPLFLAVNLRYGAEVAKELSPLWIGGPLLVALYFKMLQVICSLYVFSFKQSVKVVKNFACGKLNEFIRVHLWQHVVYFSNLDHKEVSKRMWEDFQMWLGDKCLDYVESMWSYRKTVEFLKMAKVI